MIRKLIIGVLVCVAITFAVHRYANLGEVADELSEFQWGYLPAVLASVVLYYLMKGLRWHFFLRKVGIKLPPMVSLVVYLAGQWFAFSPLGEFVKAYLLGRYGVNFRRASSTIVAQVLIDFISLAILGSVTLLWYPDLAYVVLPFSGALSVGVVLLHRPGLWRLLDRWQQRFRLFRRLGFSWEKALENTRLLTDGRTLLLGLALGLPTVLVGSATLLLVSLGLSAPVDMPMAAFVYSLSQLLGAMSMLPHGLGAVEGGALALFARAGFEDTALAAAVVALFRMASLGWGVGVGGLALLAMPLVRSQDPTPALEAQS